MTPVVAIVGRPNVGKSTLFNRLTRSHQALVDDMPGVTRDRLMARANLDGRSVLLVDTGGFDPPSDQQFAKEVHAQIQLALEEADVIVFLLDGREGLNPTDHEVASFLRKTDKPVIYTANKVEGPQQEHLAAEFHALGIPNLHMISAAHGHGVPTLVDAILEALPEGDPDQEALLAPDAAVRISLIGRPNVGKSSLLNSLVGEDRVVVSDVPGTTRDAVDTPFEWEGEKYMLIDTAGIRRRGKIQRGLEKASIFRSLRAVERAHIAVVLIDVSEGVTDQDIHLVGEAVNAHRGLIVCLNKWDLLKGDERGRKLVQEAIKDSLRFAPWAPVLNISAKTKRGINRIMPTVQQVWQAYNLRIGTGQLNQLVTTMVESHQPPMVKGRRPKIYYATQAASRPPSLVFFVSDPKAVHFSYQRYLANELRAALELGPAPLRLVFRERSGRKPQRKRT